MSESIDTPLAAVPRGCDPRPVLSDPQRLAAIPEASQDVRDALAHLCALTVLSFDATQGYASLTHETRQVAIGAAGTGPLRSEWPTDEALCVYTIAVGAPVLIGDLREDPEVRDNPAIRAGYVAYAGATIRVDGERVGSLCVLDTRARAWTLADAARLTRLVAVAEDLLDRR